MKKFIPVFLIVFLFALSSCSKKEKTTSSSTTSEGTTNEDVVVLAATAYKSTDETDDNISSSTGGLTSGAISLVPYNLNYQISGPDDGYYKITYSNGFSYSFSIRFIDSNSNYITGTSTVPVESFTEASTIASSSATAVDYKYSAQTQGYTLSANFHIELSSAGSFSSYDNFSGTYSITSSNVEFKEPFSNLTLSDSKLSGEINITAKDLSTGKTWTGNFTVSNGIVEGTITTPEGGTITVHLDPYKPEYYYVENNVRHDVSPLF